MKCKPVHIVIIVLLLYLLSKPPIAYGVSDFVKYPLNPIFPPPGTTWTSSAKSPYVLKNNGFYHVWYEGNNGSGWRIGYTKSSDGISNWISASQPVIPPGSSDGFEKETTDGFVRLNNALGKYQMWFTSFDTTHWHVGLDRFRTRYATSTDGINWVKSDSYVLTGTNGSWDSGGTFSGRTVIYKDGTYHMWYAGTNEAELADNPFWRIGYATSIDGLNWTKQNNGNPVVYPTKPWELNNVLYPNVLLINNIYHMWYASTTRNEAQQIVYAYSFNGIDWIKPEEQNPVLTRETSGWDSLCLGGPSVILEDDTLKMWYGGCNADLWWRVGYASTSADWLPTITPPPPVQKNVIVAPGIGASWNAAALLSCGTINNNNWSLNQLAEPIYAPIQTAIRNQGHNPILYNYDWRKILTNGAIDLNQYVQSQNFTEKAYFIGHSMGGLLGRAYVEYAKENNKLDKLITIGSPHQGSAKTYYIWSGGTLPSRDDLLLRLAVKFIEMHCGGWMGISKNSSKLIQNQIPSIGQLLPTVDYIRKLNSPTLTSILDTAARNNWAHVGEFHLPFYGVTVGTLAGAGIDTIRNIITREEGKHDLLLDNWIDGKPFKDETDVDGDGTVLRSSAMLEDANTNITIPKSHTELISSSEGIQEILTFLGISGNVSSIPTIESASSAIAVIGYPASLWITDPQGNKKKDTDGLVGILNPQSGKYKILVEPSSENTLVIVIQLLENNTTLWKEYKVNGKGQRSYTLNFNSINPQEDILR